MLCVLFVCCCFLFVFLCVCVCLLFLFVCLFMLICLITDLLDEMPECDREENTINCDD